MRTGQPNPKYMINDYIFGKIVLDNCKNKFMFPALYVSNNFARIDYDAHVNIKLTTLLTKVFAL